MTASELYAQRRVRLLRVAPELLLDALRSGNRIDGVSVVAGIPAGTMIAGAYTSPGPSGAREIVLLLVSPAFEPVAKTFPALEIVLRKEA